jgi:hypothetical protein
MARQDMAAQYSPRAIGSLMRERLQVITHRDDIPHFRHEMGRYFAGYQSLTRELRMVVEAVVPLGATVGVVSKGDDALLAFRGRTGWHFPRTEDGTYAGYHPADDEAAISHLQELQRDGATFLLFPVTSFWWLEHYPGLRAYLEGAHRRVWHDQRCAIYQLLRPNDMGRHEIRERAGTR